MPRTTAILSILLLSVTAASAGEGISVRSADKVPPHVHSHPIPPTGSGPDLSALEYAEPALIETIAVPAQGSKSVSQAALAELPANIR